MSKKQSNRNRILKHLGRVGIAALSFSLMVPSTAAIDPTEAAEQVIASEGGRAAAKAALNSALKVARSKPSMVAATAVVCVSCIPIAGACTSASMCFACGILVAKTLG